MVGGVEGEGSVFVLPVKYSLCTNKLATTVNS